MLARASLSHLTRTFPSTPLTEEPVTFFPLLTVNFDPRHHTPIGSSPLRMSTTHKSLRLILAGTSEFLSGYRSCIFVFLFKSYLGLGAW